MQGRPFYLPQNDCQIANLAEIYESVFGCKEFGTFLEIGAFDGETVSNTSFLADMGWRGIYVEAVQEYALQCQIRHLNNNVTVLPCAVSETTGMIEISVGIMVSSIRPDHVRLFNELEWSKDHHRGDIRKVPCLSPNKLLQTLELRQCDLAVIDVEGVEPAIIKEWDFDILKPTLMIVETRDRDYQFPAEIRREYKEMLRTLSRNGYTMIQHDGCNAILHSQYPDALWIPSRAQYGHYLFDDILPCLATYITYFNRLPRHINLLYSKEWQKTTLKSYIEILRTVYRGSPTPVISFIPMPTYPSHITLQDGVLVQPVYPQILWTIKRILCSAKKQVCNVSPSRIVYLSRQGFRSQLTNRRIVNFNDLADFLQEYECIFIRPHEHTPLTLLALLKDARIIISEPGTTPLIGYLASNPNSNHIQLISHRTIKSDLPLKYHYSGWRYHLPWLTQSQFVWSQSIQEEENPYADRIMVRSSHLKDCLK